MKNEPAFWQRCLERGEQLLAPQPRSPAAIRKLTATS